MTGNLEQQLARLKGLKGRKFQFVYLNFYNHPRGNLMLQRLCEKGLVPNLVIHEASPDAEKGSAEQHSILSVLPRNGGRLSSEQIKSKYGFKEKTVCDHNDQDTIEALTEINPEIIILGDTRILNREIIDIPLAGVINVHPGLLPDIRGNNPYVWAILHGLPQGATSHFIDIGIDTGPIIIRRLISTDDIKFYPELIYRLNETCAQLIVESVKSIYFGKLTLTAQQIGQPALRGASPDEKTKAISLFNSRQSKLD
jgi:methionyl-tRNA formyltransferase